MNETFICDALRIPFAGYAGSLSVILAAIRDGARTITHKPNLLRKRSRRVEFWLRTGFRFGLAGRRPGDDLLDRAAKEMRDFLTESGRNERPVEANLKRVEERLQVLAVRAKAGSPTAIDDSQSAAAG